MTTSNQKYTKTAVVLHWLIGFAILGMFALGWFMSELPKEAPKAMAYNVFNWGIYTWQLSEPASPRTFYYNLHKSIGVTLLVLILIRILWRVTHKAPPFVETIKAWEKTLAKISHNLLYVLMFAMPVSGLIMATYSKYGVKWFGIPFIPGLDNAPLRELFVDVHETIGLILISIIVIHILGALKHKFIDKDGTMKRMSFH